jgi:hypothetical protein
MIETIHLRNPAALNLPDIEAFVNQAFSGVANPIILPRFLESVGVQNNDILLVRSNGKWKGLVWMEHHFDPDYPQTVVLHFYCRGGSLVREALVEGVVTGAKVVGSRTLFAWDMNRKGQAFQRLFRSAGPSKEVIRAYEFDLSEARY